jgi:FAD-dependent oxidoreductase domain-containing protein 1
MKRSGNVLLRQSTTAGSAAYCYCCSSQQRMLRTAASSSSRHGWKPQHCRLFHTSIIRPTPVAVDTLIIGGGPMGSSTAYHLALIQQQQQQQSSAAVVPDPNRIWVVEKDPTYRSASATVSAAGVRQQFSLVENVQMSAYGRDFLRKVPELLNVENKKNKHSNNAPPDVQFVEHGYLFLAADNAGVAQLRHNHLVQQKADCDTHIDLLTPAQLQGQFPWLTVNDLQLGSFGSKGEGWFDPWSLLLAWKEKNVQDLGVTYRHATPIDARRNATTGAIEWVQLRDLSKNGNNKTEWIQVLSHVVNAAGPHASDLLDVLAGGKDEHTLPFPVRPRKRSMFYFHCSSKNNNQVPHLAPLTVDPLTNAYFRSEGRPGSGTFVCGVSPPSHQDIDYGYDGDDRRPGHVNQADHELWEDIVWPALYHRVPAFGNIKLLSSWAGLYEYNTFDQNAIIDTHPELPNLMLINGFSGHGLQHSMAAGRAAAERMAHGSFVTLDLTAFGYDRLLQGGDRIVEEEIV